MIGQASHRSVDHVAYRLLGYRPLGLVADVGNPVLELAPPGLQGARPLVYLVIDPLLDVGLVDQRLYGLAELTTGLLDLATQLKLLLGRTLGRSHSGPCLGGHGATYDLVEVRLGRSQEGCGAGANGRSHLPGSYQGHHAGQQ